MSRFSNVFESREQEVQSQKTYDAKVGLDSSVVDHFQDDQQKYGSTDPRSDKSVDHKYWLRLLWNAWHLDNSLSSLYYLLHGIRCGGGELTLTKGSFRLLRGDWSEKEWADIRQKNLDPVKDKLVKILRISRVGKVSKSVVEVPEEWIAEATAPAAEVEQGRMFG